MSRERSESKSLLQNNPTQRSKIILKFRCDNTVPHGFIHSANIQRLSAPLRVANPKWQNYLANWVGPRRR